jgi:hypothetical protein
VRPAIVLLVGLLVPTLGAACIRPAVDAQAAAIRGLAAAEPNVGDAILLFDGLNLTVATHGTGWGRMEFVSTEPISLGVSVDQPPIEERDLFAPERSAQTYNEFNHTLVYVYLEADVPRNPTAFSFEWIGYPIFSRPWMRLSSEEDPWRLDVPVGARVVVLVASTVPGYNVTLRSNSPSVNRTLPLPLAPRAGYVFDVPEAKETAISKETPARIQWDRTWTAGPIAIEERSLLIAQTWTVEEGNITYAGLTENEYRVTTGPNGSPIIFPGAGVAGIASAVTQSYVHFFDRETTVEAYRHYVVNHVGNYDRSYAGISVLVVPVDAVE